MYGPVIQGKLIRFRPPTSADVAVMIAWFEDMEVTRLLLFRNPPSIEMENEWLDRAARNPDEVLWIVEHKGVAIGTTHIHLIDWKNGFGTTGTVIGDRSLWGKGLGGEVMQMRTRYAFTQLPLRKLKSAYLEGNVASAKAQAAAGYREIGRHRADMFVDGKWRDHVITEVLRQDWEQAQTAKLVGKRRRG